MHALFGFVVSSDGHSTHTNTVAPAKSKTTLVATTNNNKACVCYSSWTSPATGGSCGQAQHGCTPDCSGGNYPPWCIIRNRGCATEEKAFGGGWAYCKGLHASMRVFVAWGETGMVKGLWSMYMTINHATQKQWLCEK